METEGKNKNEVEQNEIVQDSKVEKMSGMEFEPVTEKRRMDKRKKTIIALSIIIGVILLVVLFSVIFAIFNMGNDKILNGIKINGIDVSNLSKEEATAQFKEAVEKRTSTDLVLSYEEHQTTISPKQIELTYSIEDAIDQAYRIGRSGSIIQNNYAILKTKLFKNDISIAPKYNEEEFAKQLEDINSKLPNGVKESSYYIEEDQLIITKGKEGLAIKVEDMKNKIIERFCHLQESNQNIEIPVENRKPNEIDLDKIYAEIHKEAKDAYYTSNPYKLYPHVDGVDFAISMEEAKTLLQEQKEEYSIPLKITKPEVTTDKLGTKAFPDLLSSFSTKYDASNTARSKNLALAAGKINGTVVMPGEIFSYNKVVGERTIAAGYQEAKVYENGKVVDGLGGGICQISTTLYNTVLYANLDIVSRRNHQFLTSYVGAGKDATVVYGSTDFKFKNTRNFPVKLVCSVKNGISKIDMYGIKEETEYKVEIRTTITSTIPFSTVYTDDASMAAGKEVVQQKGMNGCKSETYKVLLLNGQVVSKTLLSKDTYNPMQKLVVRGTKAAQTPEKPVEPTLTPTPEPTPEPTPTPTPDPEPIPQPNGTNNTITTE